MTVETLARPLIDVRADFPGFFNADGADWHYLDTAATAQKPQAVIDATVAAMGRDYATVPPRCLCAFGGHDAGL